MTKKQFELIMDEIEKNSWSPTACSQISNLPNSLQEVSPKQLQAALTAAYRNAVLLRKRDFWDLSGTEMARKIPLVVDWFQGKHNRSMLILQGALGTGKTTLLVAINTLLRYANASKYFVTAPVFYDSFINDLEQRSCMYNEYSNTCFLLLDELGTEPFDCKYYGSIYKPLELLLMNRYVKQLPTIITTNLTDNELALRYGSRVYDRIQEISTVLRFSAESYRNNQ